MREADFQPPKLQRSPLAGTVEVRRCKHTQRWVLVHLGTQQVVQLPELPDPEQDYVLDEDNDGDVWIFRVEPSPQPVMVDTYFDHHLLIDPHSLEQFVRTPKGLVSQHAFFRLHHLFSMEVKIPPGGATTDFQIAVFNAKRDGVQVRVSMHDLYKGLALEPLYESSCQAWTKSIMARLEMLFSANGMATHILRAQQQGQNLMQHYDWRRNLTFPSFSLTGLIFMLGRWGHGGVHGSLQMQSSKMAAAQLLEGIMNIAHHHGPFDLKLFADGDFKLQDPLPNDANNPVTLPWLEIVDLRPVLAQFEARPAGFIQGYITGWFNAVSLGYNGLVPAHDLFAGLAQSASSEKGLMPLYLQVCHGIADRVQTIISLVISHQVKTPFFKLTDLDNDSGKTKDQRSDLLTQYVDAHRTVMAVPEADLFVSLTTDKSRVKGMGVQNTAIVLPDNKAWWTPPQVLFFMFYPNSVSYMGSSKLKL